MLINAFDSEISYFNVVMITKDSRLTIQCDMTTGGMRRRVVQDGGTGDGGRGVEATLLTPRVSESGPSIAACLRSFILNKEHANNTLLIESGTRSIDFT